MKRNRYIIFTIFLLFTLISTLVRPGPGRAAAETGQCTPFTGVVFPAVGAHLTYSTEGHGIVQHEFIHSLSSDKIEIETSVPIVVDNIVTGHKTYIQHVHTGSRQVVFTSEPVTDRFIPGVLPQSDYTDLWIPPTTVVGSYINIQNQALLVGQADAENFYVGENSAITHFDSRIYDRETGVFKGFKNPVPVPTLTSFFMCEIGDTEPPIPPTEFALSVTATVPPSLHAHDEAPITITVKNNGSAVQNPVIDLEVYRKDGGRVFQQFVELHNEHIAAGASRDFVFQWTPEENGIYIGKVGIFTAGWQQLIVWVDNLIPELQVGAETPAEQGDVVLSSSFITSTPYYLSQRAVLHTAFTSPQPPSQPVLLDLELYNDNNEKVAQIWFDNMTIPNAEAIEKILDVPQFLPAGTYHFRVGIFTPGWGSLLHWYENVLTFDLVGLGQWEDHIVAMTTARADRSPIVQGETTTMIAAFMSPNTQNHVRLAFDLLNAEGVKVAGNVHEDVALPRAGTGNFENVYTLNTPADLAPGTYTLRVTISSVSGGEPITTYNNAATLVVLP